MDDLISRRMALEAIKHAELGMEYEAIESLPSAQQETKTGKWIKENIVLTTIPPQFKWHCSECGEVIHWFNSEKLTKYCPNCGAKMEETEECLENG